MADGNVQDGSNESFFANSKDPVWHSVALGFVSGVTCVVVGHPFDSVKVRLQSNQTNAIFRNLYRGVLPPLMGVVPSWVGVFAAYGASLRMIGGDDMGSIAAAGCMAGCAYSIIQCPTELVKVNAQRYQMTSPDAARKLYGVLGIKGFYRGFGACLLRDTSQSACYYVVADALHRSKTMQDNFGSMAPLAAGAVTGVAHCLVEFPFDTIKTRYQTELKLSYQQVIHKIASSSSERKSIVKAMVPMLSRAIIAHGVSFVAVNNFKRLVLDD